MGTRKSIHREPLKEFTDNGIKETAARGRLWIQRNFREWPYGMDLFYQVTSVDKQDFLDFFFVPSSYSDQEEEDEEEEDQDDEYDEYD